TNWPGLGLFRISSTKKTKLLRIFEKKIFGLSSISETSPIANCPSPGQFVKSEILR
ncbi:hypothetical protein L873DRAFT_1803082, partial [Choiromyces venosus 120613-1]